MSRSESTIDLDYGIDLIWLRFFFILLRKGPILYLDLEMKIELIGFFFDKGIATVRS